MVSGSLSLPSPGFFSPFPHGTASLSVVTPYLALDRGRPGFRQGFPCPAVLRNRPQSLRHVAYGDFTLSVRLSQNLSAMPELFPLPRSRAWTALQPPPSGGFGLLRFRSPLLPESRLISFPGVLRWFSSPGLASPPYVFGREMAGSRPPGYPIRPSGDPGMCAPPPGFSQLATAFFAS